MAPTGVFWHICRARWFRPVPLNLIYIPQPFWVKHLPRHGTERETCFISIQYSSWVCHYVIECAIIVRRQVIFCVGEPLSARIFCDRSSHSSNCLGYVNNHRRMSPHEVLVPCFSRMVIRNWRRSVIFIHDALKFVLFLGVNRLHEVDQPQNQIIFLLHNNKWLFKLKI